MAAESSQASAQAENQDFVWKPRLCGEPIKYSFYTLKWNFGYATSHLMKDVRQLHAADLESDEESVPPAHSTQQHEQVPS